MDSIKTKKDVKKDTKIRGGYWRESTNGGSWYYDFQIKAKRYGPKSLGRISRTLAQEKIDSLKASIRNGTYEEKKTSLSFAEFIPLYLKYAYSKNKPSTMARTEMSCKLFRQHFTGSLESVSVQAIDNFVDFRKNQWRSNGTINRDLDVLGAILNKALEYDYIRKTPKIEKLKYNSQRCRYLVGDEEERLLAKAGPKLREICIFALNTGMRQGEILALRWKHISFEQGLIQVEHTKNNLTRYIPINKTVRKLLLLKYEVRESDTAPIFNYRHSGPLRNGFWWACKHAGIKDFRFHDLRHTFASRLVMKGVHIRVIQQLLGHQSLKMTERYTHLSSVSLASAVDLLEDL